MARAAKTGPVDTVERLWTVPDGWKWAQLAELGDWSGGGTPSKARPEFWTNGSIPWVSPKDMKRATIDSTEDKITPEAVAASATRIVHAGSILCVMRSGILRHSFPVAVAAVDVTLNQDMRALTPSSSVDPAYLAHYLRFTGRIVLDTAGKDGTTVNSIDAGRLDRHPVPLPCFSEQQRIVARIDELFSDLSDGEAALDRAQSDLGTWRAALLKAAVTGELTADWRAANPSAETGADLLNNICDDHRKHWLAEPRNRGKRYVERPGPNFGHLPSIPPNWVWANIGQLATLVTSGSRGWAEYYSSSGATFIRAQNLKTDSLLLEPVAYVTPPVSAEGARTRVHKGDVLVTITGANVTKTAVVRDQLDEAYVSQHVGLIRPSLKISFDFLYWWIITPSGGRGVLEKLAYGAGKPGLNLPNLLDLIVPLPPFAEQGEISRILRSASEDYKTLALSCEDAAGEAANLRQSILAAAFRGELVA